jgi:hypothetical protein
VKVLNVYRDHCEGIVKEVYVLASKDPLELGEGIVCTLAHFFTHSIEEGIHDVSVSELSHH